MSEWIEVRLKDLETVKSENPITYDDIGGRINFKDGTVIVEDMVKNFGNIIEVRKVEYTSTYMYIGRDGWFYCESWAEKHDPEINRLFDELLEVI